jgi:uncharacterized repeat protein (TIGR01451 family)
MKKTRLTVAASVLLAAAHGAHAGTAAGTQISNTATATYVDSGSVARTATSNTVITTVQQVASLTLSTGASKQAAATAQVVFAHTVTNTSNGADTFTLAQVNSGAFSMANVVFYADADGNGVADNATPITSTGSVAAGNTFKFVAVATLPAGVTTGTANTMTVTATSGFNAAVKATSTDTTTVGAAALLDITANSSGAGALGAGPGAEQNAVVTNTVAPGATTRFVLNLTNGGGTADTFALQASTDGSFGGLNLPSGWTVVFKDSTGAVITNTTVNAGATNIVYADVTPASGAANGTTDLYFRGHSATSGVEDKIHEAVTVAANATQVTLVKKQSLDANCDGQSDNNVFTTEPITSGAIPGACIRYQITATNTGVANVTSVVINDDIPANTTYHVSNPVAATLGSILTVLTGPVTALTTGVPILLPNQSASMSFGVRINP